jgi:hypothetical protein
MTHEDNLGFDGTEPTDQEQVTPALESSKKDFSELGFDELQTVYEEVERLARTTFKRQGDFLQSITGEMVGIKSDNGVYKLSYISPGLRAFHTAMATSGDSVIARGSADKEEMMQAIEAILKDSGNRVIE